MLKDSDQDLGQKQLIQGITNIYVASKIYLAKQIVETGLKMEKSDCKFNKKKLDWVWNRGACSTG